MIIYIVGMSCVGKSTIGKMLAKSIGFSFYDLDLVVEGYYKKPIERIQDECFSIDHFRKKVSIVLDQLFSEKSHVVIAGTPAGLKFHCLHVYKKHKLKKDISSVYLKDSCENILERLRFYDKDSKPIIEIMDESKKIRYLRRLKIDYDYFRESYKRADFKIDINNIPLNDIPSLIISDLQKTKTIPFQHTLTDKIG